MNKWINKCGERKALIYRRIPTNICRRHVEIRKSPFGNHHSSNCIRHEPSMDAKLGGHRDPEKQSSYVVSECPHTRDIAFYKGNESDSAVEKPGRGHLKQVSKVNITGEGIHHCHVLPEIRHGEGQHHRRGRGPALRDLNLIGRNHHQTRTYWGASVK